METFPGRSGIDERAKEVVFERTDRISLQEICSHIKIPSESIPRTILAVAPCRSGTTAQLRVFAAAGIPSYYQPLKAILRRCAQGIDGDFEIPKGNTIFIKETLGPYSQAEANFDPLAVLLAAGFPKEKIKLIVELREPLSTLTSWLETELPFRGGREGLIRDFISAYKTTQRILNESAKRGVSAVPYLYEAQRDMAPSDATARLFSALEVPFTQQAVAGWDTNAPAPVVYADEPDFYAGDFHSVASTSTGLGYTKKETSNIDRVVNARDVERIESEGIQEIYEDVRRRAAETIGLSVQPSTEIEEFKRRHQQI